MNFRKVEISKKRGPKIYINVNFDTKGIIRIKNDSELEKAIKEYGGRKIGNECRYTYSRIHDTKLDIDTDSIAMEIQGHMFPSEISKAALKISLPSPLIKFFEKTLARTDVIDCGERDKDTNRWIWDFLVSDANYRNFRDFL